MIARLARSFSRYPYTLYQRPSPETPQMSINESEELQYHLNNRIQKLEEQVNSDNLTDLSELYDIKEKAVEDIERNPELFDVYGKALEIQLDVHFNRYEPVEYVNTFKSFELILESSEEKFEFLPRVLSQLFYLDPNMYNFVLSEFEAAIQDNKNTYGALIAHFKVLQLISDYCYKQTLTFDETLNRMQSTLNQMVLNGETEADIQINMVNNIASFIHAYSRCSEKDKSKIIETDILHRNEDFLSKINRCIRSYNALEMLWTIIVDKSSIDPHGVFNSKQNEDEIACTYDAEPWSFKLLMNFALFHIRTDNETNKGVTVLNKLYKLALQNEDLEKKHLYEILAIYGCYFSKIGRNDDVLKIYDELNDNLSGFQRAKIQWFLNQNKQSSNRRKNSSQHQADFNARTKNNADFMSIITSTIVENEQYE